MTPLRDHAFHMVLAAPHDDEPRRAFAEACEAEGDVDRAEFVRLQVADAIVARSTRLPATAEFLNRTRSLLSKHREEWTGEIVRISRAQSFYRGFVEEIGIDAPAFLANAPAMFELAPIRRLNLRDVRGSMPELISSPHMTRMVSLSFGGPPIGDEGLELLASSPYLTRLAVLDLRGNDVTRKGVEALARSKNLPSLKSVDLSGNPAASIGEDLWNDQGQVIGADTSLEAKEIERAYGTKPWLHPWQDFGPWARLVVGL